MSWASNIKKLHHWPRYSFVLSAMTTDSPVQIAGLWKKIVIRSNNIRNQKGGFFLQLLAIVFIFFNPVAVVQTVSLIVGFSWMNAAALFVVIIGGASIEVILIHIHDSWAWKQILGYFHDLTIAISSRKRWIQR